MDFLFLEFYIQKKEEFEKLDRMVFLETAGSFFMTK